MPRRPADRPSHADALSYIYLLLQELEPMAADAEEEPLRVMLSSARQEAARALKRQSGA